MSEPSDRSGPFEGKGTSPSPPLREPRRRDGFAPAGDGADAGGAGASASETDAPQTQAAEPTSALNRRRLLLGGIFVLSALAGMYFLLPKLAGLHQTWGRLRQGDPFWLLLGAVFEALSIAGYAALFATVFGRGVARINWRASIEIPLAGIAAIRLLAAAGAGGVAVTAWALRSAGMSARVIACRMVASYAIQYSVYLGALIVCGLGLRTGLFAGQAPFALTVPPAVLSAAVIVLVLSMGLVPQDFERRLERLAQRSGRVGRIAARFATAPATVGSGVRTALTLVRERRVGLLGAVAYWGFDIAVLGVCFRAFGGAVPVAVLVMGYFLGTLGSLLPLPGGIGGVEGGMIGAFAAFGVPGGRAVVAVLAYRAISFWLPTLPGIIGYFALRSTIHGWRIEDTEHSDAASAPQT
ncbi:MAG: flippase-like domain-containing protein [Solirubrobacterales bacterium]|nr:flippase-like domain-containing protein [Solirubrobacterales bacterium]MBV9797402.1 flippase-like domain-containing protein [Solirubrobacterales bacterium]